MYSIWDLDEYMMRDSNAYDIRFDKGKRTSNMITLLVMKFVGFLYGVLRTTA